MGSTIDEGIQTGRVGPGVQPRHRARTALAALLVAIAVWASPAASAATEPAAKPGPGGPGVPSPTADTEIINGTASPAGQWPSLVEIQRTTGDHWCGGTVIAPTWILTAAHCFYNQQASSFRVRSGSNNRSSGGTLHALSSITIHPSYSPTNFANDAALLHLATPTLQPAMDMSPSAAWDATVTSPGTGVWAAGWGSTVAYSDQQAVYPESVRHVGVTVQTSSVCTAAGDGKYTAGAAQICAWADNAGTCKGDSGGPLMAYSAAQSRYYLVGLVSYAVHEGTRICAPAGYATVFTRVSSHQDWIANVIETGPHENDEAFIRQVFVDFVDRAATSAEVSAWKARMADDTWAYQVVSTLARGAVWEREARAPTRLYRAFFLRDPDTSGLRYWKSKVAEGSSIGRIAEVFARSPEFASRYGSLTNSQFIDLVYRNVLGRTPDTAGRSYWLGRMARGTTRGTVMANFSESPEYRKKTDQRVDAIAISFGMNRRAPTAAQLSFLLGKTRDGMAAAWIQSYDYALRF